MISFEWDDEKAARNRRLHGIEFEEASVVFDDPFRCTEEDSVFDGEQRLRTVGRSSGVAVLLVIHLEVIEDGDTFVRIIPARGRPRGTKGVATKREIKRRQGDPISAEALERIKRLAEMPDELINTDDIPEHPFGQGKRVQFPSRGEQLGEAQRKAS